MSKDRSAVMSDIANMLLSGNKAAAKTIICQEYPHTYYEIEKRAYTMDQKMNQFISDGFIDRYTGKKLLNPGILKILSNYFPNEFPYQPHWKMTDTHIAYWELVPTLDHIYPIAKGGHDDESNWVTTSMKSIATHKLLRVPSTAEGRAFVFLRAKSRTDSVIAAT